MVASGSVALKAIKHYLRQAGSHILRKFILTTESTSPWYRRPIEVLKISKVMNQY
jgi:adenine-specific DNA methylase